METENGMTEQGAGLVVKELHTAYTVPTSDNKQAKTSREF